MNMRSRAKSQYFLVSQVSIKNAPSEVLVCVRSDEQNEWSNFLQLNEECGIAATYKPVGQVYTTKKLHTAYVNGLAKDAEARETLSNLSKEQLVELALQNGLCVSTPFEHILSSSSPEDDLGPCSPTDDFGRK